MKKLSLEEFKERLEKKNKHFRNGYFTIIGEFVNCRTKIKVLTPYGICDSNPYPLLAGDRPTIQTALNMNEYFINQAREVHGDRYSYEKSEYKRNNSKVIITCKEHGDFKQKPNGHLLRQGCPKCNSGGWADKLSDWLKLKSDNATFYILRCFSDEEEFIKVGITTLTVKERYPGKHAMPYNYEILYESTSSNKEIIWDIEVRLLKELRNYKYKPSKEFGGYTECFNIESLKIINI